MRVAVVNDLRLATHALVEALRQGGHEIAWTAVDGRDAIERCRADRPDLILMDLIMPVMDGVEATRRIMAQSPCPILVVTATVSGNATRVYEALGAGALDAVDTPTLGSNGALAGVEPLLRRIDLVRRLVRETPRAPAPPPSVTPTLTVLPPILALGASTGGPQALATILRELPRPTPFAVVAVQHLGGAFVPGLIEWLGRETRQCVRIARDGEMLEPGVTLFPPGDHHLVIDRSGRVRTPALPESLHRPSVDILFESLAASPGRGVAALLTGMGSDGAAGLTALAGRGWWTIAQDEATSVVWGMPNAAIRLGGARQVLPVTAIAGAITLRLAQRIGGSA